ncbi:MAG TPA: hypothetical protein PLU35_09425 [Phycisphaerales bacterium]|nr:hypothetical protein [Phycisphaerales bacterium]
MEANEGAVAMEDAAMESLDATETGPEMPRPEDDDGASDSLEGLAARLAEAERRAGDALAELERVRLEREIDRELLRAGAADVEAARDALGEVAPGAAASAVAELRRSRPALFARREGVRASAASVTRRGAETIEELAAAARTSGDRRLLLRYLRQRRAAR